MENENYPCVMGMLRQSSRRKENYEFCENKHYPKPQRDTLSQSDETDKKENCECCEMNDSLSPKVTGLSQIKQKKVSIC